MQFSSCWRCGLGITVSLSCYYLGIANVALGQISADGILPTQVNQSNNEFTITGGTEAGSNLFHSFAEFSVPSGRTASFNNALNINNIFSRVTGGSISQIEGIIKSNGMANLFLINPNGIVFGPNAQLNVGGSFFASTASSLKFADGTEFSATHPQSSALLTMSAPIGLQFGSNPGSIINRSQYMSLEIIQQPKDRPDGLIVNPGKTLALIGGDVVLDGGYLTTPGGRIELGSVAGNSFVKLTASNQGWQVGYEGVENFQDIHLSQNIRVDASGTGGTIQIQARRVTLTDGSQVGIIAMEEQSTGDLTVNASESVELIGFSPPTSKGQSDGSGLFVQVGDRDIDSAIGQGGNLIINTKQLILHDGGGVSAGTFGSGQGGRLEINASQSVEIIGTGFANTSILTTSTTGAGDGGELVINTERLIVRDGGQVFALTVGSGKGGTVTVNAPELIEVSGTGNLPSDEDFTLPSSISVASGFEDFDIPGTAEGGNLSLNTGLLIVKDGGEISVGSFGTGNAGNLNITAGSIFLENQGKLTAETTSGEGGNISLQVSDLLLLRHNSLISTTAGTEGGGGNGGNIDIMASFLIAVPAEDSNIIANAFTGAGGNINLNAIGILGIELREQLTPLSDITASSDFGQSGMVNINRPDVDPESGLLQLSAEVVDNGNMIVQRCGSNSNIAMSEFTITGRGGLPPEPTDLIDTHVGLADLGYSDTNLWRQPLEIPTQSTIPQQLSDNLGQPIVEARGWLKDADGKVWLTAASNLMPHRSELTPATCYNVRQNTVSTSLPIWASPDRTHTYK